MKAAVYCFSAGGVGSAPWIELPRRSLVLSSDMVFLASEAGFCSRATSPSAEDVDIIFALVTEGKELAESGCERLLAKR
ncbi:MAG: hypothetical protein P4M11_10940 [Candidatus Pacebacteria bacterium]|nr:hypothetical protein [Candidatus Paceibacterota bacterium]